MGERKTVKFFVIHQFTMSDLYTRIVDQLRSFPSCSFVNLSLPEDQQLPADQIEFVQDYACGRMMDSDIVILLPDAEEGDEVVEVEHEVLGILSGRFRSSRGLSSSSVYTEEINAILFDSCNRKPVLVVGWTRESAEHLAAILRNPESFGGRPTDSSRFYTFGLNEAEGPSAIAEALLSILRSRDLGRDDDSA